MASAISNLLGGNLLSGVAQVINSIRGKNPEDAAKLEQLKEQYQEDFLNAQANLAKAQIDENVALNQDAAANIQAEAKENWYTSAARPSIIWVGLALMVWNYGIVGPLGKKYGLVLVDFPEWFWSAWKVCALGYVFARTADKVSGTLFGGAGGTASLPFGIKLDSKGDK
jgi:hypothetical protein